EGADDALVGLLEEALAALRDWRPRPPGRYRGASPLPSEPWEFTAARLRVRVLARLAVELYYTDRVERRAALGQEAVGAAQRLGDRKSTRLNSSHGSISYAVFCLKKKKIAWV